MLRGKRGPSSQNNECWKDPPEPGESVNTQQWCLGSYISFDALITAYIAGQPVTCTAGWKYIIQGRGLGIRGQECPCSSCGMYKQQANRQHSKKKSGSSDYKK